jgi:HEAT repeat protein
MTPSMKRSNAVIEDTREPRIRSLLDNLASRDPVVREKARWSLVVVGKPAVPSLIPLLSHRKVHIRWETAKTLCDIADPIAAIALVNALDDSEGDVRWLAAEGLAALGCDGLQPLLAALLERAQSTWFCEGAHHVCHALANKKKLGTILRPVLAALEHAEPAIGVPLAAYIALSKLRESS